MKILAMLLILIGSASILYGVCNIVLTLGKLKKDRNNVESIEHLTQNPQELNVLRRPAKFVVGGFVLFVILNLIQRFN